eukprot:3740776-Karenia_brevis.AAC.1
MAGLAQELQDTIADPTPFRKAPGVAPPSGNNNSSARGLDRPGTLFLSVPRISCLGRWDVKILGEI